MCQSRYKLISEGFSHSTKTIQAAEVTCCHPSALKLVKSKCYGFFTNYTLLAAYSLKQAFVRNSVINN